MKFDSTQSGWFVMPFNTGLPGEPDQWHKPGRAAGEVGTLTQQLALAQTPRLDPQIRNLLELLWTLLEPRMRALVADTLAKGPIVAPERKGAI